MTRKYSLPSLALWTSVILSSTTFGLMLPHIRTLPLVVGLMFYTTMYHSALLVSSITNNARGGNDTDRFKFYMDPIEGTHLIWTFCFVVFWTVSFVFKTKALVDGASEDADYLLAIFCGIEWLLNTYISYLSFVEWRRQQSGEPIQSHDLDLESSAESATILREINELQILYQFAMSREEKRAILTGANSGDTAPPTYTEPEQM